MQSYRTTEGYLTVASLALEYQDIPVGSYRSPWGLRRPMSCAGDNVKEDTPVLSTVLRHGGDPRHHVGVGVGAEGKLAQHGRVVRQLRTRKL